MIVTESVKEMFIEATKDPRWGSIDFLLELSEKAKVFTDGELSNAEKSYKKARIRKFVNTIKGPNGEPLFASIVRIDKHGKRQRVYKQELLFKFDDYEQVVAYHKYLGRHHLEVARGYVKRCNQRFDEQLPLPYMIRSAS
jgi:hypothetical protein